jgi:FkbM family methyltransferase
MVWMLPDSLLLWGKKHYYPYAVQKFWEPEVEPIKYLIKPGDVAVDLGANIGWYTSVLARLVGERGIVYAIEPIPTTFLLLTAVIQRLHLANVRLFNCAVSDKNGFAVMELPRHEYGGTNFYMARIVSERSTSISSDTIRVALRSLDDILSGEHPEAVTFVKCDVEGHELAVLKGARTFFNRARPAMLIEVTGTAESHDDPNNEFFSLMRAYGYTPYWFDGKNLRKRPKGHWCVNYFFFQPSHVKQLSTLVVE